MPKMILSLMLLFSAESFAQNSIAWAYELFGLETNATAADVDLAYREQVRVLWQEPTMDRAEKERQLMRYNTARDEIRGNRSLRGASQPPTFEYPEYQPRDSWRRELMAIPSVGEELMRLQAQNIDLGLSQLVAMGVRFLREKIDLSKVQSNLPIEYQGHLLTQLWMSVVWSEEFNRNSPKLVEAALMSAFIYLGDLKTENPSTAEHLILHALDFIRGQAVTLRASARSSEVRAMAEAVQEAWEFGQRIRMGWRPRTLEITCQQLLASS